MYANILIPTDGSRLSEKAVRHGVLLARSVGAGVIGLIATPHFRMYSLDPLISSSSPPHYEKRSRQFAARALGVLARSAARSGVPCKLLHVVADDPCKAIVRAAARNRCDLILMSSHGRGGLSSMLLGSVTTKVLSHSKIPVLVCR